MGITGPLSWTPILPKALESGASGNLEGESAGAEHHNVSEILVTKQQQDDFRELLGADDTTPESIPIEWVVDVADESGSWFIATAYSYNDSNGTLHVMVPDKENPDWEGHIAIDSRVLHLLECCHSNSMCLFKVLLMHEAMHVNWEVECDHLSAKDRRVKGSAIAWLPLGCYIIFAQEGETPRLVSADESLHLISCKDPSQQSRKSFVQLVRDGRVSSVGLAELLTRDEERQSLASVNGADTTGALREASGRLQEILIKILNVRDTVLFEHMETLGYARSLILEGDLDQGEKLVSAISHERLEAMETWCTRQQEISSQSIAKLAETVEEIVYHAGTRNSLRNLSIREVAGESQDEFSEIRKLQLELQESMEIHRTLRTKMAEMNAELEAPSPPRDGGLPSVNGSRRSSEASDSTATSTPEKSRKSSLSGAFFLGKLRGWGA